jgi:hypothetical protein
VSGFATRALACSDRAEEGACLQSGGKGACGQAAARDVGGLRFAPTALRCSVSRAGRATRVRFAPAQTLPAKSVVEARCARGPRPLRFSAPPTRAAACPHAPLQRHWWRAFFVRHSRWWSGRRCPSVALWGAPRSAGIAGLARGATQHLTWPGVSERERSGRELPRRPAIPSTAGQSERSGDRARQRHRRAPPAAIGEGCGPPPGRHTRHTTHSKHTDRSTTPQLST